MTKACCFCLGFIASRSCLRMSLSLDMLMVRTKSSAGFTSPSPTICPSSSSSSSLVDDSGTFLNVTPLPDIAAESFGFGFALRSSRSRASAFAPAHHLPLVVL
eukprot:CAMPEP_0196639534 /NCGR_PEP_ID=MMETSP1085-20130531/2095_1 /TAXON_ID=41879 ORGANISM="Pycnococcus sp, Strain CCMP1998" /NCGR_SAMPLE_ID=MMETSP1085 /ASSEMBLY_ACC=CAM_ASM_000807 /LENGTH=102 /DNA_ID=CAMNT_0041968579 /DNA_START=422 /DNA_END=727 /DNA_ORIENTATION=-